MFIYKEVREKEYRMTLQYSKIWLSTAERENNALKICPEPKYLVNLNVSIQNSSK